MNGLYSASDLPNISKTFLAETHEGATQAGAFTPRLTQTEDFPVRALEPVPWLPFGSGGSERWSCSWKRESVPQERLLGSHTRGNSRPVTQHSERGTFIRNELCHGAESKQRTHQLRFPFFLHRSLVCKAKQSCAYVRLSRQHDKVYHSIDLKKIILDI